MCSIYLHVEKEDNTGIFSFYFLYLDASFC